MSYGNLVGDTGVSIITAAELAFGAAKNGSIRNPEALAAFLLPLEVAPFDMQAALVYGEVKPTSKGAAPP